MIFSVSVFASSSFHKNTQFLYLRVFLQKHFFEISSVKRIVFFHTSCLLTIHVLSYHILYLKKSFIFLSPCDLLSNKKSKNQNSQYKEESQQSLFFVISALKRHLLFFLFYFYKTAVFFFQFLYAHDFLPSSDTLFYHGNILLIFSSDAAYFLFAIVLFPQISQCNSSVSFSQKVQNLFS